jgi:hypothetical protein
MSPVIASEIFVKRNNKNRVQMVTVELSDINGTLHCLQTFQQFGKKESKKKNIVVGTNLDGEAMYELSAKTFNRLTKQLKRKGFVSLSSLTNKDVNSFTPEALLELINGSTRVSMMLPCNFEKCASTIFESPWYCSDIVSDIHGLVLWEGGQLQFIDDNGDNYNAVLRSILQDKTLLSFFNTDKTLIFDCYIYSPLWKEPFLKDTKNKKRIWFSRKEVYLQIADIVSTEMYEKRLKMLDFYKQVLSNPNITFDSPVLVSGWLYLMNHYIRARKKGHDGIILHNPSREYGTGKCSSLYMIKLTNLD